MLKPIKKPQQYKLGVHPVSALKASLIFNIDYIAHLALAKLF